MACTLSNEVEVQVPIKAVGYRVRVAIIAILVATGVIATVVAAVIITTTTIIIVVVLVVVIVGAVARATPLVLIQPKSTIVASPIPSTPPSVTSPTTPHTENLQSLATYIYRIIAGVAAMEPINADAREINTYTIELTTVVKMERRAP